MFVDGTFNLGKESWTCSSVLVDCEGVGVPVAWALHETKTADFYQFWLQSLVELQPKMHMDFIFSDFEKALSLGAQQVFNGIRFLGDLFHFVQVRVSPSL